MTLSCTELRVKGRASPHFSSLVVARRRKGRPGKACDRDHSWRAPAVVLVQYVEEADGAKHSQGG